MAEYNRRHINIGTIGHVDHGKTTLTQALTYVCHKVYGDKGGKAVNFNEIDKSPEEIKRGITIKQTTVQYGTEKTVFSHVDCPGHKDYVKNMIVGTAQMDVAILVVSADGAQSQTAEHVLLARQINVKKIIVFLNKCDVVDSDIAEMAKEEIVELLHSNNYPDFKDEDIIMGSALKAVQDEPEYFNSVKNLVEYIENNLPEIKREVDKPFLMSIDQVMSITGRGTVVTGLIEKGKISINDEVEIVGDGKNRKTIITGIGEFRKNISSSEAGRNVGVLLRGISKDEVWRGMVLCAPGSCKTYNKIKAETYFLKKEEGGRSSPIHGGYRPQFFVRTGDYTGVLKLGKDEMIMPGDNRSIIVEFEKEIPIDQGVNFAIREGGKTIGAGKVVEVSKVDINSSSSDA